MGLFHYYNIYFNNKHGTIQLVSQKSIFLKSGQIRVGNSVAYIQTRYRTLAIATNTESGVPFSEITSSTGGSTDFTWNNNNGYHLHEIIHDIIKTTYTYLLYSYTIDTTGVFNGYNRRVKVATNNYDVNSLTTATVGEYYFPAGQTMTFRFLIYRAHGDFNIQYSGIDNSPAYYGTICTPTALMTSDIVDEYSIAVYDESIDDLSSATETNKFKTGLSYYMTSADGYNINYNQEFQTSYYLYGIM